jgi:hypothetical protein
MHFILGTRRRQAVIFTPRSISNGKRGLDTNLLSGVPRSGIFSFINNSSKISYSISTRTTLVSSSNVRLYLPSISYTRFFFRNLLSNFLYCCLHSFLFHQYLLTANYCKTVSRLSEAQNTNCPSNSCGIQIPNNSREIKA